VNLTLTRKINRLTEGEQAEVVADRRKGLSWMTLLRKHGIAHGTLAKVLRHHGLLTRTLHRLNARQQKKLIQDYCGDLPMSKVASRHRVSLGTVSNILRRHGIPARPLIDACRWREVDETAFDHINEASAYWIGFLMADGSIDARRKGKGSPVLTLSLAVRDLAHLKKFRVFLRSTHCLTRSRAECKIAIASRRLSEAVAMYGVVPQKTKGARVIGLELDRHFWRGVVDGDGYIQAGHTTRNFPSGAPGLQLVGSPSLLAQFRYFVCTSSWPEYRGQMRRLSGCHCLSLKGYAAYHTLRVLYGDCAVALTRKLTTARRLLGEPTST